MKTKTLFSMVIVMLLAFLIPVMGQIHAANAKYADGDYTVPFSVLKATSNEESATVEYMVSPAKVKMQNDKATVTVTLNNSSWWQSFQVQGRDVQVVSEANDRRVVKFDVADISQPVNAKIHIIVTGIPGFDYDNKYDIRLVFNTSSFPPAPVQTPVTPPAKETKPVTKPVTKPAAKPEVKPEVKQVQKPAGQKTEKPAEKTDVTKNEVAVNKSETASKSADTEKDEKTVSTSTEKGVSDETEDVSNDEEDELIASEEEKEEAADEEIETEIEEAAQEEAVAVEVSDEKDSSNTTLFIALAVGFAVVAGGIAYVAMKKRARK
ncbi:NEAT domain-containing protein [Sporosarcina highlanderae]|uniref:NEAT domain-containing protein n=1 Tax=Sporosarcina highlanderae TaxID=3035916 RepID=A0ABT8JTC3_9BACL|nr:NEAT domain-containing protein [Sporosarcina highlanderae]MDN4608053.1 NEAT domain-containing protein [Sporosarcina highlanderae]